MFETLKSLPFTFYSRPFFEDTVLHKKGFGFSYILVLAFLSLVGAVCHFYGPFNEELTKFETGLPVMPEVQIKDGKLSVDKPLPYITTLGVVQGESMRLMIDTRFKDNSDEHIVDYMKKNKVVILLTETKAIARKSASSNNLEIFPFTPADDEVFTKDVWTRDGHVLLFCMYSLLIVSSAVTFLIVTYLAVLILAVLTWIFAALFKVRITFQDAIRIAATSGVPAGFLAALWIPLIPKLIIWAGYALFAIGAARHAEGKPRSSYNASKY